MIYLLTLGWPWFAGACALGALVGFLTYNQAKNAAFSGGWIVLLGLALLGGGAAVSYAELLDGREATMFDIGLLATAAYALGLPAGGVFKSMFAAPETARAKPAQVIVTRSPAAKSLVATKPAVVAGATSKVEPIKVPPLAPVMETEPFVRAAVARGEAGPAKQPSPGSAPPALAAPRGGAPDDLARIKGLGPRSVEKLHALGVYHYDQIAGWDDENTRWIDARIGTAGRVQRGKWVQQARALTQTASAMENA